MNTDTCESSSEVGTGYDLDIVRSLCTMAGPWCHARRSSAHKRHRGAGAQFQSHTPIVGLASGYFLNPCSTGHCAIGGSQDANLVMPTPDP